MKRSGPGLATGARNDETITLNDQLDSTASGQAPNTPIPSQFNNGPKRVQQRRTQGWQKPAGAISVARPHKWGNPSKIGEHAQDAAEAVQLYRQWLPRAAVFADIGELAGHDLMCFCPLDQPCHADILLEVAACWSWLESLETGGAA